MLFNKRKKEIQNILGTDYILQQYKNKFRIYNLNSFKFTKWYCNYKTLIKNIYKLEFNI